MLHTNNYLRVNSPSVVSETVDDEVIIINLESGAYYSLRSTAAVVWGLIEQHRTGFEIAAAMSRRQDGEDAEIRSKVSLFLEELAAENLILPAEEAVGTGEASIETDLGISTSAFEPPSLSKYTDMEHFLQVDPIHEVGEQGWPNPKK